MRRSGTFRSGRSIRQAVALAGILLAYVTAWANTSWTAKEISAYLNSPQRERVIAVARIEEYCESQATPEESIAFGMTVGDLYSDTFSDALGESPDYVRAVEAYERVLSICPKDDFQVVTVRGRLMSCYAALGLNEEAARHAEAVLKARPEDFRVSSGRPFTKPIQEQLASAKHTFARVYPSLLVDYQLEKATSLKRLTSAKEAFADNPDLAEAIDKQMLKLRALESK